MKKLVFLSAAFLFFAAGAFAQKIKLKEGKPDVLKGEKLMAVEFKYDDMTVGKKLTEEEYVARKVAEYNEKEAGSGDKWKEAWTMDRVRRFEPKFMLLFNEHAESINLKVKKDVDTKYKLIVHTYYTEPGFNVGVAKKDAMIHVRYELIDTETNETICIWEQEKVPGRSGHGGDFDTGSRIAESYAKAGKSFGKLLSKELK